MTVSTIYRKRATAALKYTAVVTFYLLLWQIGANLIHEQLLVPSPLQVGARLVSLMGTLGFWRALWASLARVIAAFCLGVALGTVLAVATSRWKWMHTLVSPLLSAIRATPVSSFIILALIWMGASAVPVFTGLIMTLPIVWGNVVQGIARCDSDLFEVAKVYRLGPLKKLKFLYLPQVAPAFATACSTSMGLTWKAVIAAEVLGTPKLAMGSAMYASKIYLETADLFAWTLVVIALSVVLERFFARLMNKLSRRWGWEAMP